MYDDLNNMMSFKEAAYEILTKTDEPLSANEIVEIALQEGLLSTEGQTPEATMGAQLYVDIKTNKNSPFTKVGKGRFTLKTRKDSVSSPLIMLEKQNERIKKALKDTIDKIDPYQFEFVIADLLKKLGFDNVTVTKRSGDGGIDVIANLTVGGLTNVKTVIQAKRWKKNVPGKVITQLRGSAERDHRGLVITTSNFTKDAIRESKAANKIPISLVNGEDLISLMFENSLGIKKEEIVMYSLDNDYFQNEYSSLKKDASSNKNRSIWPLPGGIDRYVDTLNNFLSAVDTGINTKSKLIRWFIDNYDNVKSERTAQVYIFVPKSMGLVTIKQGKYLLTNDGDTYLQSRDLNFLYGIITKNIFALDEIMEYLKTAKEPKDEKNILEYLEDNLGVGWTTYAQVNFRLLWLINLNKIKKLDDGYVVI